MKFCAPSSGSVANDITPEEFWSGIGAFAYEVSGAADAVQCVAEGSLSGCLWTALTILTLGLGAGLRLADKTLEAGTTAGAAASVVAHACSFTGETKVLMADGSQKPISDIGVGDLVLATNPTINETLAQAVIAVAVHSDAVLDLQLTSGGVTTTDDHPFWSSSVGQFVPASRLQFGDQLLSSDGSVVRVIGLRRETLRVTDAFNLEVASIHTYYVVVGRTPVLVHNGGGGACGASVSAALDILPLGRSSRVRIVNSEDDLQSLYGQMSEGGVNITPNGYNGTMVQLADGTTVGYRNASKSGGATIDIELPGGSSMKVHIDES